MKYSWKKCLSLVLAILLILTAIPALAEQSGGGGQNGGQSAGGGGGSAGGQTTPTRTTMPIEITGPYEVEQTSVSIASRDVMLDAVVTVPVTDAEKYPVAILVHGFLGSLRNFEDLALFLGKNGIASVNVSLMGSGNSEGLYEDSDFDTQADDVVNTLHFAQTLDIADVNNMFLIGESQGGFNCAMAALRVEEEINGICLWYPAFTIPDDYRDGLIIFRRYDVENIPDKVEFMPGYAVGRKMIEQGRAIKNEEVFPAFGKDVLIIHGDQDTLVNCQCSIDLYPLYPHADLILISGSNHGFHGLDEINALYYTLGFIHAHLAE